MGWAYTTYSYNYHSSRLLLFFKTKSKGNLQECRKKNSLKTLIHNDNVDDMSSSQREDLKEIEMTQNYGGTWEELDRAMALP